MLGPDFDQPAPSRPRSECAPLAAAVLQLAVYDLNVGADPRAAASARAFFTDADSSFRLWCDVLGIDAEWLATKVEARLAAGVRTPRGRGGRRVKQPASEPLVATG